MAQYRNFAAVGFAVALFFCAPGPAQEKPAGSPTAPAVAKRDSVGFAMATLRAAHAANQSTLLPQDELDAVIREGGGGACGTAIGVNLLQALRVMSGDEPLPNPHRVALKSFTEQPDLLNGRVTNSQFVQLLDSFQRYLRGTKVSVDIETSPSYVADSRKWKANAGPDLIVHPRQAKVLSFTVTARDGRVIGRHFVLLEENQKNEIVVFDPTKPGKPLRYVLELKHNDRGEVNQVFLLQPVGAPPRDRVFELNSVFTVTLISEQSGQKPAGDGVAALARMKNQVDGTAAELRQSKELTSPRLWRKKSASYGLPGLDLPRDVGGHDWSAVQTLEVFRHAGRHDLNCRDVVGGAHGRLLRSSNHADVREILKQVAGGDAHVAITMTEPTAGSDYHAIKSTATKVEGGFRLTGEKRYVARLAQATHVVVFTRAANGKERSLSVFVLPINTPGLEVIQLQAHGLLGNSFGGLKFNDLFVKDSQLLGNDGDGNDIFTNHFRYWRLMQVAAALGTGEKALEMLAERLKTREAFGSPIGRFSHLQQPLGQFSTQLSMAHALAAKAAAMLDTSDDDQMKAADELINGLKAEGVEIAIQAVDAAMRAHGAAGYSNEFDLGDRLRDLIGLRIADGTTDVMRMDVVRRRFGKELWDLAVRGIDRDRAEK